LGPKQLRGAHYRHYRSYLSAAFSRRLAHPFKAERYAGHTSLDSESFGFACLQYGIADGIEGDGGFDVWMLDALTPDTVFTAGGNAPVSSLAGARFRLIAIATRGVRRT
jgi:hypothetical protein